MSDLNLLMADREVILAGGSQGSGKSYGIAKLVERSKDEGFNIIIADRDRGLAKALREVLGRKLPDTMDYYLLDTWDKIYQVVADAESVLGIGDWLVFEHCGKLWEQAQNDFAEKTYGGLTEHLLAARVDAEQEVANRKLSDKDATRERAKKIGFGGMEGRYDWPLIKRMHNAEVFDRVILGGEFNVLTTTSLTPLMDDDIKAGRHKEFHALGSRPEGEKNQVYRHDTILITYQKDGKYLWRTDLGNKSGKDRGGRPLVRDVDCMKKGFLLSYLEHVNADS